MNKIKVYKDYLLAKNSKNKTATEVAKQYGITRTALYQIVREIEDGNEHKISTCSEKSIKDCLWTYRYEPKFKGIPKNRKPETVNKIIEIVKAMVVDGFNVSDISKKISKDRSTVLYYINRK